MLQIIILYSLVMKALIKQRLTFKNASFLCVTTSWKRQRSEWNGTDVKTQQRNDRMWNSQSASVSRVVSLTGRRQEKMRRGQMSRTSNTVAAQPCLVIFPSSWLHKSSTRSLRSRTASRTGSKEASRLTATAGSSPVSRGLLMDSHVWGAISHRGD